MAICILERAIYYFGGNWAHCGDFGVSGSIPVSHSCGYQVGLEGIQAIEKIGAKGGFAGQMAVTSHVSLEHLIMMTGIPGIWISYTEHLIAFSGVLLGIGLGIKLYLYFHK